LVLLNKANRIGHRSLPAEGVRTGRSQ